jgi:hypothetical protein
MKGNMYIYIYIVYSIYRYLLFKEKILLYIYIYSIVVVTGQGLYHYPNLIHSALLTITNGFIPSF